MNLKPIRILYSGLKYTFMLLVLLFVLKTAYFQYSDGWHWSLISIEEQIVNSVLYTLLEIVFLQTVLLLLVALREFFIWIGYDDPGNPYSY